MPKYGYVVVEGPHDVELVYRLLSPFGLSRVRLESELDPFFGDLVPRTFPHGGDLQKRVPVPLFLQSDTHAVAVHSATGDSRLVQTIEETAVVLDRGSFTGIGVLLDSDSDVPPVTRYAAIRDALREKGFALPEHPGHVGGDAPRLGAFVLPDCASSGTLETVLLECAGNVYPTLLASASAYVDGALAHGTLSEQDRREVMKPAGRNKAIVGSIASVLKPGRAVQVSIQDNRWLRGENLELPSVKAIQTFLTSLLELP